MSEDRGQCSSPPQYIVTTPSEVDTEEERSIQESAETMASTNQTIKSETTKVISQSIQKQTKKTSQITTMASSSTSQCIESMLTESAQAETCTASSIQSNTKQQYQEYSELSEVQQFQQTQQQTLQQSQVALSQKSISTSKRSQSLKSSSMSEEHSGGSMNVTGAGQAISLSSSSQLDQQLKAKSSTSITMSEQRSNNSNIMQKISLGNQQQQQNTKTKFQSFLQHPEAGGHMPISGNYLTAHQKHVRQFVRSTSAHSEATVVPIGKEKCTRSASTQQEDSSEIAQMLESGGMATSVSNSKLGIQQTSSVLLSKSAETIEMKSSSSGMRTQLTLSGGFLAPPNRKITILSPINAPPGLHDMLKRTGRSPISPRISFPGIEADLFG